MADWLNIMFLHIKFRVNRASKKVQYDPEAPVLMLRILFLP